MLYDSNLPEQAIGVWKRGSSCTAWSHIICHRFVSCCCSDALLCFMLGLRYSLYTLILGTWIFSTPYLRLEKWNQTWREANNGPQSWWMCGSTFGVSGLTGITISRFARRGSISYSLRSRAFVVSCRAFSASPDTSMLMRTTYSKWNFTPLQENFIHRWYKHSGLNLV